MPNDIKGELVPCTIDWHDSKGWSDQESADSDRMRKTWPVIGGQSYIRVQVIGSVTKIFPAEVQPNTIEIQSTVNKDSVSGFPGVFYYKVI